MKRLLLAALGLALSMSLLASAHTSQSPPATFKGRVVDPNVALIPKATVVIEGAGQRWELETSEAVEDAGEVNVELPAGRYKFTVEAPGFKKLVVDDFRIASCAKVAYEFRLEVRGCDDCGGPFALPDPPLSL